MSDLASRLKLSERSAKAISDLKQDGVSAAEVTPFLQTESGKEFLKAIDKAPKADFNVLVDHAGIKANQTIYVAQ